MSRYYHSSHRRLHRLRRGYSDLTYLSHVAAILFRKVRALAEEMVDVTAAYLFANWTRFRGSWTPGGVK